jgi:nucleotide-binding universal stress UspA family protein
MYERILVPTDGSEGMDRVVEHAVGLARRHGATLDLVYVVDTAAFANLPMETSWEGIRESLREEGATALEAAEAVVEGVPSERHVLEGGPSREIVDYAERSGADLVVMGTHGRGGLNRLLLGSVAERVVRSSPVPVLTIRVGTVPEAASNAAD